MRIVIDMQGAQSTGSRNRGIGRYTLSLAQAIVRNRGEHEIILALSGLFPDTIESIRANFDGLLPQENIRVWYAPSPVRESQPENIWRRKAAELIREAFIASLKPGVVFIPNFIEGYHNDVVTSIGLFSLDLITVVAVDTLDRAPTAVGNHGEYIHMLRKHEHLKRANLLLVLPPLTVDEVCQCLEIPQERVNVGWLFGEAKTDQQDATTQAMNLLKRLEELTIAAPQSLRLPMDRRPKLAYVSPLPPERSGISDYSAELLPQLARFYDIDVIVDQVGISTPWIIANCGIRTIDWFIQNARRYSRVLYHFGNSPYHQHMIDLLARVSGVVVLHDFYLVDVHYYREAHALSPHALTRALYESHGYGAVAERFRVENDDLVRKYPANLEVLQHAHGIIVHAEYPRRLAREWYGKDFAADWKVIPHLRTPCAGSSRAQSRATLGLKADDLVVCSFGLLSPNKLNHRLLEAWLQSRLARDAHCLLVFVGENHGGEYGAQLRETIRASGLEKRIRITDWADMPTFRNYLAAADIAVQLRTHSRGETSGTVLDCMNHALPTIVNAHGSMADFPSDPVWTLPDAFEDGQLVEALETLWQDGERRAALGARAREVILTRHAPRACAKQYAEAIEQFHARSKHDSRALTKSIADLDDHSPTDADCLELAQLISHTLPITKSTRQLLVDVSATCRNDLKTGIQRVVRALVWELLQTPPPGYRVEPVYLTTGEGAKWHYRYARKWTSNLLGFSEDWMPDEPVEYSPGDIMLVADFTGGLAVEAKRAGVFKQLKGDGIGLFFVAYDLLPLLMPNFFPPGQFGYMEWLNAASCVADGVICISRTVADEMRSWVDVSGPQRLRPIKIGWFHLGADINASIPTLGLPKDAEQRLSRFSAVPSFLMVGTIEPRKGYLQTIEAFTQLWQAGCDINLVIVGNQGWKGLSEDLRRTIPEIVGRVRNHQELGKHLFWLEEISDEYLEKIYAASICLIAASEGEGFGLPLIEAAQHKLPIIAREIPVFREVAGEHAFYFKGLEPQALTDAVWQWLALDKQGKSPRSDNMPRLTWKQSAEQLIKVVFG